jgi:hypothetical protein
VGIWLLSQYLNSGAKHDIQLVELGPGRGTLMDDILRVRYFSFKRPYIHQTGPRRCHNSHILARLSSAFTSWNQVQLFELFRRRNFRHGVAKAASNYIGTTPSRIFPQRMVYTPCWLRTSSSTRSRFISSKYATDTCTVVRLTPSIFVEKSSRLERGLDHLYSRSSCQNYPETFRRRFLP